MCIWRQIIRKNLDFCLWMLFAGQYFKLSFQLYWVSLNFFIVFNYSAFVAVCSDCNEDYFPYERYFSNARVFKIQHHNQKKKIMYFRLECIFKLMWRVVVLNTDVLPITTADIFSATCDDKTAAESTRTQHQKRNPTWLMPAVSQYCIYPFWIFFHK